LRLLEGRVHQSGEGPRLGRIGDWEGSFPVENIEALRRSGVSGATVPPELGSFGVDSILDYVAGVIRLGRGDLVGPSLRTAVDGDWHLGLVCP